MEFDSVWAQDREVIGARQYFPGLATTARLEQHITGLFIGPMTYHTDRSRGGDETPTGGRLPRL